MTLSAPDATSRSLSDSKRRGKQGATPSDDDAARLQDALTVVKLSAALLQSPGRLDKDRRDRMVRHMAWARNELNHRIKLPRANGRLGVALLASSFLTFLERKAEEAGGADAVPCCRSGSEETEGAPPCW